MNVLEAARFVRQQPLAQIEKNGVNRGNSQWTHAKYQNVRIDTKSKEVQLLRQLYYGSIRGGREPAFVPQEGSTITGWIDRPFTAGDYRTIDFLTRIGLVQVEKKEKAKNRANIQYFSLTPEGRRSMEIFIRTSHLPESIRRKLLETGRRMKKKRRGGRVFQTGETVKWS